MPSRVLSNASRSVITKRTPSISLPAKFDSIGRNRVGIYSHPRYEPRVQGPGQFSDPLYPVGAHLFEGSIGSATDRVIRIGLEHRDPGYSNAAFKLRMFGEGFTQVSPVESNQSPRCQLLIFTTCRSAPQSPLRSSPWRPARRTSCRAESEYPDIR